MKYLDLPQGSDEWLAYKKQPHILSASEAAAMLGLDKKITRQRLLAYKHTGIDKEFSDYVLDLFLRGHEAEKSFLPIADHLIGDELYPEVGEMVLCGLTFLASFDGITMDGRTVFEHKIFNSELEKYILENDDLPDTHWPQVEQQLLVSGADSCFFVTSDGTIEKHIALSYTSKPDRRQRVIEGWKQFDIDLANYQHVEPVRAAVAEPIASFPALFIQAEGKVISSNLDVFKKHAEAMFKSIKTELVTDQDFVDAAAMVKHLADGENRLEQEKVSALAQTASLADMFTMANDLIEKMKSIRLVLKKRVESEKETRKTALLYEYAKRLSDHENELNASIASGFLPLTHQSTFADCIKGKSKLESMENALHARLLELKADATQHATRIKAMVDAIMQAGAKHLFADIRQLALTPMGDEAILALIAHRQQAEKERIAEAEARAAAQATAQAEAKAKREADEAVRIAMIEERARAQAEEKARLAAECELRLKAEAEAKAKQKAEQEAAQVIPVVHNVAPVQRADDYMVREFMKQRGMDDSKMRSALIEFIKYVRSQEAQA